MQTQIQHILTPVQLDAASLSMSRQVAEFAREHNADLQLLHIADVKECSSRIFNLFTRDGARDYNRLTKEKTDLLTTWKRWLEKEYGIKVSVTVDWCDWKTGILKHAGQSGADLIAIREEPARLKRTLFRKAELEYIIEKSPCQVITFFSGEKTMHDWKQIVMPVTDCIPESRIQAIVDIAKKLKLMIHLVTVAGNEKNNQCSDFYFLTETLKRLKPNGNIQVECRCLNPTSNPVISFLNYAHSIGADLLMTNMRANRLQNPQPIEAFNFMEYA